MLINDRVDIQDFVRFTNSGLIVANFNQIKDTLIHRYKLVYGQDVDFSTGNADGVYINELALLINNILQSFKSFYSNLDVNEASGNYLDNLCSLSNVFRKKATNSNTYLTVKNLNTTVFKNGTEEYPEPIQFIDKAGNIWTTKQDAYYEIQPNESATIYVEAEEKGPLIAKKGWINNTIESLFLTVNQPNDATIGLVAETDDQLRVRRAQSSGANGTTVLDSLVGALLNISGIRDVKIYSNTLSNVEGDRDIGNDAKDGTNIPLHNVYVIVRYDNTITDDDLLSIIGNTIYNKMTPGIYTTQTSDTTNGESMKYTYIPQYNNSPLIQYGRDVFWKKAKSINPQITVELNPFEYFDKSEGQTIGEELINYLNNLAISSDITTQDILIQTSYADPLFQGYKTFNVGTITIANSTDGKFINKDTFFKYSVENIQMTKQEATSNWLLTIS